MQRKMFSFAFFGAGLKGLKKKIENARVKICNPFILHKQGKRSSEIPTGHSVTPYEEPPCKQ